MSAPAWMPLYIGDYLRDTRRLRAAEHGAYLLLIMEYWQTGGNLPDDDRQLARIAGMTDKEWKAARSLIEGFFQPGWRHKRIDEELAKANAKSGRRSEAGKRGGIARANAMANARQTDGKEDSNVQASSSQSQSQSPATQPKSEGAREAELDRLESRLREAAGLQNATSPGLFDLSPIVGLIGKGYDLETDILPKLRAAAAAGKTPSTWAYFVPAITEGKAKNGAIPEKALDAAGQPVFWLSRDDPRWSAAASHYETDRGKPPAIDKNGGWHFPADYPELRP